MNERLRQERKSRHWSVDEAARHIGVSRLTYMRWEQGTQTPHGSSLRMACEAFDLSAEQLGLGGPEMGREQSIQTAKFLTLTTHELLQRYDEDMLQVEVGEIQWRLPHVVIFDNSAWHVRIDAIHVRLADTSHYSIPAAIATKAQEIMKVTKHFFHDSTTIRLHQIIHDEAGLTLLVAKAHYYDYLGTNYAVDAVLTECGWTKSLRDVVHPEQKLEQLEASLLANHIGVSVLAFTSDNYLCLPTRAQARVGIWQNLLVPSISGATNFDDMYDTRGVLPAAWMREGRDELQLEQGDFGSAVFLGLTRELLRGGKPEAFFALQLTVPRYVVEHKWKTARDGWESQRLQWVEFTAPLTPLTTEQEKTIFLQECAHLINQHQEQLSQPLQANLALWFKYMLSK